MMTQNKNQFQKDLEAMLRQGGYEQRQQQQFDATGAITAGLRSGAISEWERREPVNRQRSISADYALPLLTSLTSGGFCGGLLAAFSGDLAAGGMAFGLASALTWAAHLVRDAKLNWRVERIVGRDLDGDGYVGEPERQADNEPLTVVNQAPTVSVEVKQRKAGNHWQLRYANLPVSEQKLKSVAIAVLLNGASFSRRALSDVLTQSEYDSLATAMLDAGLLFALSGNRRELSAAGRALLRQILPETD